MSNQREDESLLLPPKSRLLYIGPQKTGTTSLQEAAKAARSKLFDNGVYYPGTGRNHWREIYAFMGRAAKFDTSAEGHANRAKAGKVPPISLWNDLMADIAAESSRRVLISHESAARASDAMAEKFVSELGSESTHIAITLRSPASILASRWVQALKIGRASSLDGFLKRVYGASDQAEDSDVRPDLDQGRLVERWVRAAGPENVTVIVLDNPSRLTDTFEELLGLPEGTLMGADTSGTTSNRSMSLPEADVFRQANEAIRELDEVSWPLYLDTVKVGAVRRVLDNRAPGSDEPRVRLPRWAADLAAGDGTKYAERIADSGARVVGDLAALHSEPDVAEDESPVDMQCYRSIAVEVLVGAYMGAMRYENRANNQIMRAQQRKGAGVEKSESVSKKPACWPQSGNLRGSVIHDEAQGLPQAERVQQAAQSFSTRDLARALKVRLQHKLRRGESMPLG